MSEDSLEDVTDSASSKNANDDMLRRFGEKLTAGARKIFDELSLEELVRSNATLSAKEPALNREQLAKAVINACARQCAGVGLAASSATMIPVIGTGISYASIIPEELMLLKLLFMMVLRIADVYGVAPKTVDFYEVLYLVGWGGSDGHNVKKMMMKTVTQSGDRLLARALADGLAERMFDRVAVGVGENMAKKTVLSSTLLRGIVKRLPLVGLAVSGGMNVYQAKSVGRRSIRHFQRRAT
ncbi:hypothetical protein WDW37_06905 [Bdellovibrionota bacterium FG-1]